MEISPRKRRNTKQARKLQKNALDTVSKKPPRGRPPKVFGVAIKGRSDNYRGVLHNVWERLSPALLEAKTENDVINAFEVAQPGGNEFLFQAPLILRLINDPMFPQRRQARINFLADSLASLGLVSPRRSRDICTAERARVKRTHHIIRYEFYVECSCGYKGHSKNHACRKCGASIRHGLGLAHFF
jgi:hypothetical protein